MDDGDGVNGGARVDERMMGQELRYSSAESPLYVQMCRSNYACEAR